VEEVVEQHGARGAGVHLAHVGYEDVAVDAAEEAHLIRVDAAPLRPVPHRSQTRNEVVEAALQHTHAPTHAGETGSAASGEHDITRTSVGE
jgi:hypothetical protein